MARSFPLALKLSGRKCVVVGNSLEAVTRAEAFSDAGAKVHVVGEDPCQELVSLTRERGLILHERPYAASDLADAWLAVLTERDLELAARIAEDADATRVFFCAVDMPEHGSFSHVALARAGVLTLALSTEGQAPALARRLREEFQRLMDEAGLAAFTDSLATLRARTPRGERKRVLGAVVSGVRIEGRLHLPPPDAVRSGT